jgi:tetratricopeptide (TPR) repeat protein
MQVPGSKSNNAFNLVIALILGVLWAFFWAIDKTVAYVLFGAASFFFVLFFYNRIISSVEKSAERKSVFESQNKSDAKNTDYKPRNPQSSQMLHRAWFIVIGVGSILVVFFLYLTFSTESSMDSNMSAEAAYSQGDYKYTVGDYDSAAYYFKRALNEDNEMDEAWIGLGNALYSKDKKDSALYAYQKAIDADPGNSQGYYNVSWWYYDQHNYSEAIRHGKRRNAQDPSDGQIQQLIGDSYYEQQKYDSAIQWYEGAYSTGVRSRWLCHVMAYIYDTKNDLSRAIPLYKEALEYEPSMIEIHQRLGELLPGEEGAEYRTRAVELKTQEN